MIGIVIISHGNLGVALSESAEMIFGEKNDIVNVSISSISENAEVFRDQIVAAIDSADRGNGVVVLTDLFGGTPCNLAISIAGTRNIEIVAGVNLPMVLKLLSIRAQNKAPALKELAEFAKDSGKKQISVVSDFMV